MDKVDEQKKRANEPTIDHDSADISNIIPNTNTIISGTAPRVLIDAIPDYIQRQEQQYQDEDRNYPASPKQLSPSGCEVTGE